MSVRCVSMRQWRSWYFISDWVRERDQANAMAGVFDIDLDQADENVSDDELGDGVSSQLLYSN